MIDLNDPQLDENGKHDHLLKDETFKQQIENDCIGNGNSSLKDAKYIVGLWFGLDLAKLYVKTKQIES